MAIRRHVLLTLLIAVLTALAVPAGAPRAAAAADSSALREAVTVEALTVHLREFQAAAEASTAQVGHPTRVDGSEGYERSVAYVADLLEAAGYKVTRQEFTFERVVELSPPVFERVTPDPASYAAGEDFLPLQYSGSGNVETELHAVDLLLPPGPQPDASTSGCEPADFAQFPTGAVALLQRGTCTFTVKARNAQDAGASGVVIFNEGTEGRPERGALLAGSLGPGSGVDIPVVGSTFTVGAALAGQLAAGSVTVRLAVDVDVVETETTNVLADSTGGTTDEVVVVGAHLDSVAEGPGINDNATGSAAILEVALQLAELGIEPANPLRFAFWGGEEFGLLGAEHYVTSLAEPDLDAIALNLNFDMVGSPNGARFVYDGDGSETPAAGPDGSDDIERMFLDYFSEQGLATLPTAFDGRSDYGPFIARGIPAGGLFTGAEELKTPEQAEVFGGTAGEPYDPCYHRPCDDLGNVDAELLGQMADAIAHAVHTAATT